MEDVSIAHAKDHLEDLVARAANGEEVVIRDPKLGTVRLQALHGEAPTERKVKRVAGHLAGKMKVPEGLFDPLPEDELKRWTGEDA
jgi:antitoxin (DNA-binding transcriptional repressor) of toxin-antitoxin stability system